MPAVLLAAGLPLNRESSDSLFCIPGILHFAENCDIIFYNMKRMTKLLRNGILFLLSSLLLCGFVSVADEKTVPNAAVFGDADGDGELTVQDASCITRHLTGFKLMDAAGLSRADYDGDGLVTELDASLILNSFAAPEFSVPATKSVSMLFTSDMRGFAWDPAETEENSACTVMNVAACVAALREKNPNLYLIDAGGSLLGSSIADDYAQKTDKMYGPVTALFVKMQYDAVLSDVLSLADRPERGQRTAAEKDPRHRRGLFSYHAYNFTA